MKIGELAKRLGVSTETLRKWEERHGALSPRRSDAGTRHYPEVMVTRASQLKQLVDAGMRIGDIGGLSSDDLASLCAGSPGLIRVALEDRMLKQLLSTSTTAFVMVEAPDDETDVVVLSEARPGDDTIGAIRDLHKRTGIRRIVVCYNYAAPATLMALRATGARVLRMPMDPEEFSQAILDVQRLDSSRLVAPPPRIDKERLSELMGDVSALGCGCHRHLAEILVSLLEFESFSRDCAERFPDHRAEHLAYERYAGFARAWFEEAVEFGDGMHRESP